MAEPPTRELPDGKSELDVVVTAGLSVHVFGNTVGIYCDRIEAGRGFAEMPLSDFKALLRHFSASAAVLPGVDSDMET